MTTLNNHACFKLLCEYGTRESLPKDYVFYDYYNGQDYIYCLTEGICALISLKECGKEHIYQFLKPGSLICFVPAYLKSINQSSPSPDPFFMVVSKSNCIVHKIHHSKFFSLISEHPELIQYIMFSMAETSRNLLKHLYTINESNTVAKLAFTLLALSEEEHNQTIITKEFNYTELAKYLGIHHITVSKIMSIFKDIGVINKKGRQIIILDKEELILYSKNLKTLQY